MGQKRFFLQNLGELGGTRTPNPLIRSQKLYPIKLLVLSLLTLQKYSFFLYRKQKNAKIFAFYEIS